MGFLDFQLILPDHKPPPANFLIMALGPMEKWMPKSETGQRQREQLIFYLRKKFGVTEQFNMKKLTVQNFLGMMESGYAEAIYMEKTDNIWNRRDNPSSTII
jgi:hypothetical protein